MAELKPEQAKPPAEELSLSRWSRLKRAAKADVNASVSPTTGGGLNVAPAPEPVAKRREADATVTVATQRVVDELPPMTSISLAADFTPFMQAQVPQVLKQQALKALFKAPHFNVMDGLDIYIDDYTVFEPISPEVMASLSSWKNIMNPPRQVVTPGGYAVNVESEEGRAVLAAQAERAMADAALVPELPGESPDITDAVVAAETPVALAKPHPRHGTRVGDFSAAAFAAADAVQASAEAATHESDAESASIPQSLLPDAEPLATQNKTYP